MTERNPWVVVQAALILALLAVLFWQYSALFALAMPRGEASLCAVQLMLGATLFWWVGQAFVRIYLGRLNSFPSVAFSVLTGQLLIGAYVYVRSSISFALEKMFGLTTPVTLVELLILVVAAAAYVLRKSTFNVRQIGWNSVLPWLVLGIGFLVVCESELPREIMLSSDPDLHLFFASQVKRFGLIPFHQYEWGPESFHYPAGFAVLNFLWASFSQLSLTNIISAQCGIQTSLALLVVVEAVLLFLGMKRRENFRYVLGAAALFAFYYFLMPLGYEEGHRYQEGTGRMSSLGVLAYPIMCWVLLLKRRHQSSFMVLLLMSVCVAQAAQLNPISAILPGATLVAAGILALLFDAGRTFFKTTGSLGLLALACVALIAMDPYYMERLFGAAEAAVPSAPGVSVLSAIYGAIFAPYSFETWGSRYWSAFTQFVSAPFLGPPLSYAWLSGLAALYFCLRPFLKRAGTLSGSQEFLIWLLPIVVFIVSYHLCIPAFSQLKDQAGTRLLYPYYLDVVSQTSALFLLGLLAWGIVASGSLLPRGFAICVLLMVFIAIGRSAPLVGARSVGPRVGLSPPLGSVYPDDRIVLEYIQSHYREFVSRFGRLSHTKMPKILVPSYLNDLGWGEKWIFPHGATRLLPTYETFPLAFFYSHGSKEYSFFNYKRNVCRQFKPYWLKERNIRYMFIPTERGPVCVRGLKRIIESDRVLYRSGDAMFVELSD